MVEPFNVSRGRKDNQICKVLIFMIIVPITKYKLYDARVIISQTVYTLPKTPTKRPLTRVSVPADLCSPQLASETRNSILNQAGTLFILHVHPDSWLKSGRLS